MKRDIKTHRDLDVYQRAFAPSIEIFGHSKSFPKDENYSLTDQIRRSSRAVCANLAEAWRKRQYPALFQSKLCDSESEAAETQVWLEFAVKCGYLPRDKAAKLYIRLNFENSCRHDKPLRKLDVPEEIKFA